jgi:hypothetical protein
VRNSAPIQRQRPKATAYSTLQFANSPNSPPAQATSGIVQAGLRRLSITLRPKNSKTGLGACQDCPALHRWQTQLPLVCHLVFQLFNPRHPSTASAAIAIDRSNSSPFGGSCLQLGHPPIPTHLTSSSELLPCPTSKTTEGQDARTDAGGKQEILTIRKAPTTHLATAAMTVTPVTTVRPAWSEDEMTASHPLKRLIEILLRAVAM